MRRLTGVLAVCLLALSSASAGGGPATTLASVDEATGDEATGSRAQASAAASNDVRAASTTFRDVPATSPHAEAIAALAETGVTAGCAAGRFCPRQPVTRDQMASFLVRALDIDRAGGSAGSFSDVSPASTHAAAIAALARAGITSGCAEGRYCPRQPVTRDQMASFLVRAFGLPDGAGSSFRDVPTTSPHAAAVDALAAAGITAGCAADRYCPRQPVTRDQMASFLARALGLVTVPGPSGPPPSTGPAPDDAVLAFVREPFSGCTGPCGEQTTIWTVRVDGGGARAVTQPVDAYDRHPRWSPDGRALAFVRTPRGATAGEVHLVEVAGGGFSAARPVTSTGGAHGGSGCHGQEMAPVWSPDSQRIAVTCAADAAPDAASHVYVVGADGSGQFAVSAASSTADERPTWSPDSQRLAFARTDLELPFAAPERVTVWVADVSGAGASNLRALVADEQAAGHPRWSPSGDRILYVSVDESVLRPSLRTVRTSGGEPATIYTAPRTEAVQLYAPAWSPGGSHVAFPVGDGLNTSAVHVVAASGGPAPAVSPEEGALAFAPAWGPTSHLAFDVVTPTAAGAAAHQLATAAADGTGYRTVTIHDAYAYDADWHPRGDLQ